MARENAQMIGFGLTFSLIMYGLVIFWGVVMQ